MYITYYGVGMIFLWHLSPGMTKWCRGWKLSVFIQSDQQTSEAGSQEWDLEPHKLAKDSWRPCGVEREQIVRELRIAQVCPSRAYLTLDFTLIIIHDFFFFIYTALSRIFSVWLYWRMLPPDPAQHQFFENQFWKICYKISWNSPFTIIVYLSISLLTLNSDMPLPRITVGVNWCLSFHLMLLTSTWLSIFNIRVRI